MKAVVLVGGEGTRMRPLTETIPKPLLPLMNRPALHEVLDHLADHGVHEVILSSSYLEEAFHPFIEERHGDPAITWITEATPLGTAGAIVNALPRVDAEPFFVLNGDILTDLDLAAMLEFHRGRGALATISLTHVPDARAFGLVPTEPDGRVIEFREKPRELVPGDINAGTYVLEPGALDGWEAGRAISIEREVFPALIARGLPVHGYLSDAYWMDLGTPEKYLQSHFDLLDGKLRGRSYEAPLVAEDASVDPRAHVGVRVVLGSKAVVQEEAQIDDSVAHAGAVVGSGARVVRSVLGPGVRIGRRATVSGSVLAEGAAVAGGVEAAERKVSAGRTLGPGDLEATEDA